MWGLPNTGLLVLVVLEILFYFKVVFTHYHLFSTTYTKYNLKTPAYVVDIEF